LAVALDSMAIVAVAVVEFVVAGVIPTAGQVIVDLLQELVLV
jgi:hypothetical protein